VLRHPPRAIKGVPRIFLIEQAQQQTFIFVNGFQQALFLLVHHGTRDLEQLALRG
jgi:hypothetical protein